MTTPTNPLSPADLGTAFDVARQAGVRPPAATGDLAAARAAAQEFEAVFIAQMLQPMFAGLSTDGPFGGGRGEEVFRSQLIEQYGKEIAAGGGIGLTDALTREILSLQEV
jgi:Rod binding domain-containing protein